MSELQPAHGQSARWSAEFVDQILWEVAAAGGNVARAHMQLVRWATDQAEENGVMPDIPSERTVRSWIAGRYRNRYHEVQQLKVAEMDEVIAQSGQRIAVLLADGEEKALKQTLAGLASANAIEASNILRNLSVSKKVQVDTGISLRRTQAGGGDARSLNDLVHALERLGGGTVAPPQVPDDEDIVEAEVIG